MRFILTIHDLTKTSLGKLDAVWNRHLKLWSGLPKSATTTILHMRSGLGIPSVSQGYYEAHALSHLSTRLKGDHQVNEVLDAKINREEQWTRKTSTCIKSQSRTIEALTSIPLVYSHEKRLEIAKTTVKKTMKDEEEKNLLEHAKSLAQQGRLIELISKMEIDATWKSYIYGLPKGTAKFIINVAIDSLPTKANLMTWGKRSNDRCRRCGWRENLNHILSACRKSLDEGRFTYRHNNIIKEIIPHLEKQRFNIYSDIEGFSTSAGGTIPPNILVTSQKPDLVIVNKNEKAISLIELTVPWESRLEESRRLKTERYSSLISDIKLKGYKTDFIPLEVGVRGILNRENQESIRKISKLCNERTSSKSLHKSISKSAVSASYFIFLSRDEEAWNLS